MIVHNYCEVYNIFCIVSEVLCFRVMRISLVHDMAESIVGDLTPHCGVSPEDKHKREVAAMENFRKLVGEKAGNEMFNLFMVSVFFFSEEFEYPLNMLKLVLVC